MNFIELNVNYIHFSKKFETYKKELSNSQKALLTIIGGNSKSKSLVNVTHQQQAVVVNGQQQQQQQPPQPSSLDKNEKMLLKKYARYSKASPKSVSAVVRQPTLTSGGGRVSRQQTISKQSSLSQFMLNKLNLNTTSAGNVSKMSASYRAPTTATNDGRSQQNSLDTSTQDAYLLYNQGQPHKQTNDNCSVVSSKISLFKKTVSVYKYSSPFILYVTIFLDLSI